MTLTVERVSKSFGGFQALTDVSLEVASGSILGLIGPNGSGKSTLINVITGVLAADAGTVLLDGEVIDLSRPDRPARAGIVRVFQIPRVVRRLTVLQNVMLAAPDQPGESVLNLVFARRSVRMREAELIDEGFSMLDRLGIGHEANNLAARLSGGQLKLLSLAMLMMRRPRVFLLDEPAAGVNPTIVARIVRMLDDLRAAGHALVLVEHNMALIHELCDDTVVLGNGRVVAHGPPSEVARDRGVVDAFLGIQAAT